MKEITTNDNLPAKLSKLLEVALKHLRKYEKDPAYAISMGYWVYKEEEVCHVCLAGAAMLGTECIPKSTTMFDTFLCPNALGRKMLALNALRVGEVGEACRYMSMVRPNGLAESRVVHCYHEDPEGFYEDMEELVQDLKKHKL